LREKVEESLDEGIQGRNFGMHSWHELPPHRFFKRGDFGLYRFKEVDRAEVNVVACVVANPDEAVLRRRDRLEELGVVPQKFVFLLFAELDYARRVSSSAKPVT